MSDHPVPRGLALPAHDVEHSGREDAGGQFGQAERGQRRQLGRLEDDGASRRQGRRHLPGRHVERVVPRSDGAHHADGIAPQHRGVPLHVLPGRPGLEEATRRCEEPPVVDGQVHLEVDDADRLAHVERLEPAQLRQVRGDGLGQCVEGLEPLPGGRAAPGVEGASCCSHGIVDVARVPRRDGADHVVGGGVDDVVGGTGT